jgi:hypothetical protein
MQGEENEVETILQSHVLMKIEGTSIQHASEL